MKNLAVSTKEYKSEKDQIKGVVGSLSQVLHLLDQHWEDKLSTGRTIEEHYDELGLHRFTKVTKSGKVTKKGYTPNTLSEAVNKGLRTDNGGYRYFKSVPVMWIDFETMKSSKVYYAAEADKLCAYKNGESSDGKVKNVAIFRRVNIEADGWAWGLVDTLLEQSDNVNGGAKFNSLVNKEEKSHKAYAEGGELYIVNYDELTQKWVKKEVNRDEVTGPIESLLPKEEILALPEPVAKVDVDVTPAKKNEKAA